MSETYNPIINYWPDHIAQIKEFVQQDVAADKELNLVWSAAYETGQNRFLSSMDADECAVCEEMLGINPLPNDTLEDRRRRIKGYYVSNLPYTQNKLKEVLTTMCTESGYVLTVEPAAYKVDVAIKLSSLRLVDNVKEIVNKIVPANMIRNIWVMYNRWSRFSGETWGTLAEYNWEDIFEGSHWQT